MLKKYSIYLPTFERDELLSITKKGKTPAYRIKHAQILLNADKNGPNLPDWKISEFIKCHPQTVFNVRKRYHEQGLKAALDRKVRQEPPIDPILDGHKEAQLIAIACSQPPDGYSRWTFKLISEWMVELEIVEKISPKTVERALKKRVQISFEKVLGDSPQTKR